MPSSEWVNKYVNKEKDTLHIVRSFILSGFILWINYDLILVLFRCLFINLSSTHCLMVCGHIGKYIQY